MHLRVICNLIKAIHSFKADCKQYMVNPIGDRSVTCVSDLNDCGLRPVNSTTRQGYNFKSICDMSN